LAAIQTCSRKEGSAAPASLLGDVVRKGGDNDPG
jgi:hypothetical protein